MSMAAKSSDLSDKTSEASLQVDGQVKKPAQGAVDWQEMEEEEEATVKLPQYETLPRNMSNFNR